MAAVLLSRVLLSRALVAAVATAVLFALKATTIAAGRDAFDDPFVNGFFYAGALLAIVGLVMLRSRASHPRRAA